MQPNNSHVELLQRLKDNVLAFGKIVNSSMFSLKSPKFHSDLADIYHDKSKKQVCIQAPRGFGKTSIIGKTFTLHHLMFDEGVKFVVIVSKTEGHGKRILNDIKDVLNYNEPFRKIFGYWGEQSAKIWTTTEIMLKDGSYLLVRGAGQPIAGLNINNQRPTLFIYDDPEDIKNTLTEGSMEQNFNNLLTVVMPALNAKIGRIWIVGTPFHANCMVEKLHKSEYWESRKYKAIQDDGTSLWEEMFPVTKLTRMREEAISINRYAYFSSQYQCTIIASETQLFKEDYICGWDGYHEHKNGQNYIHIMSTTVNGVKTVHEKPLVKPVNIFVGVDPATSVIIENDPDYFVIMPIAIDEEDNRYVLPYFRNRVAPSVAINKMLEYHKMYKPQKFSIETTGAQETFRDILRNLEGVYIAGLNLKNNPKDKKDKRYFDVLEPWFYKRRVFLLKESESLHDELLMHPNGDHDDTIDGLYWAFKGAYKPTETTRYQVGSKELYERFSDADETSWMSV